MKIHVFIYPTVVWRLVSKEPPWISAQILYCQKLQSLWYISAADSMGLSSLQFLWRAPKTNVFWNWLCNGPSRSSKVVDFDTNRKRVCNFLLVINSNIGPILLRFRDVAGFPLRRTTPSLFDPNFWGVPPGLDWRCCGSEERGRKCF